MITLAEKTEELKRDGFVFFRQLFPGELSRQAHAELMHWFERDNQDRAKKDIQVEVHNGPAGKTVKTEPSHLMIDAYGKSPALDSIVEIILTHPIMGNVFRRMVGEHFRFRGYNVRLMTGSYDSGPPHPRATTLPHEWHRDSPGEFGIGIFLTEVSGNGNGGTALIPGSHLFPYCPRWNTLLNSKYYTSRGFSLLGKVPFVRFNVFNRILGKLLSRRAIEATGTYGDCYYFLNDVWHGRYPNRHGRQTMIVLIGGFPTEFPTPDEDTLPSTDAADRLPPSIRKGLLPQPKNQDGSSIVYWMLANRSRPFPLSLFSLARLERLLANQLSRLPQFFRRAIGRMKRLVLGIIQKFPHAGGSTLFQQCSKNTELDVVSARR